MKIDIKQELKLSVWNSTHFTPLFFLVTLWKPTTPLTAVTDSLLAHFVRFVCAVYYNDCR